MNDMTIKISGITYHVKEVPFIDINGDRNFKGVCRYDTTSLEIIHSISEDRKSETLIHEITHAIAYEANVEMSEDDVTQFSKVLYQVLIDNDFSFLKK